MIDEAKRAQIVSMIRAGRAQLEVAHHYRITQQMVSKIWREENGLGKGRRGGDRRSKRYRRAIERRQKEKKANG